MAPGSGCWISCGIGSPHRIHALHASRALVAGLVLAAAAALPAAARTEAGDGPPVPSTETFTLSGPAGEPSAPASGAGASRVLRSAPERAQAGWTASLDVDDGSQAVAVSWAGQHQGTITIRGWADGTWTGWRELNGHADEAPDASARTATQMIWFGATGVDRVELRVVSGHLRDLQLQAVLSTVTAADASPTAMRTADGRPTINPRSAWTSQGWVPTNPDCEPGPVPSVDGIEFAVVHHTDNSNTYTAAEVPAMLRAIYAFHTGTNQWCDIAYNFLVDRFGRIWEGRSGGITEPIKGGHAKGFNSRSVGVALLGQHQPGSSPAVARPTAAALEAVGRLIGWKFALHGISPTTRVRVTSEGSPKYDEGTSVVLDRVSGHRDVGLTDCPGDFVLSEFATIRSVAVATAADQPPPPAATAPFRLPGVLVTQQYRDVLGRPPTLDRYAYWSQRVGATTTPGAFIASLLQSSEADRMVHSLTRLYRAYFLRNPDHDGFSYWTSRRANGTTLAAVSNAFARSSEFRNRYGDLTDDEFVQRVYQNVLGRPADPSGTAYWSKRLAAGTARGEVMTHFSQSDEYVRTTKRGNEIVAAYETLLVRAVTPTAYATLLADPARSLTDIATSLFASASYQKRFATPR